MWLGWVFLEEMGGFQSSVWLRGGDGPRSVCEWLFVIWNILLRPVHKKVLLDYGCSHWQVCWIHSVIVSQSFKQWTNCGFSAPDKIILLASASSCRVQQMIKHGTTNRQSATSSGSYLQITSNQNQWTSLHKNDMAIYMKQYNWNLINSQHHFATSLAMAHVQNIISNKTNNTKQPLTAMSDTKYDPAITSRQF